MSADKLEPIEKQSSIVRVNLNKCNSKVRTVYSNNVYIALSVTSLLCPTETLLIDKMELSVPIRKIIMKLSEYVIHLKTLARFFKHTQHAHSSTNAIYSLKLASAAQNSFLSEVFGTPGNYQIIIYQLIFPSNTT